MDFFSKHKFATITIVILVLLNLFTISIILIREFRGPFPTFNPTQDRARADRVMHFLKNELDLTKDQSKQFRQLRHDHFEEVQKIQNEMHDLKKEIMDELFTDQPNEEKLEGLTQKIGQFESKREMLTFRHFLNMKSVCTIEQKEKFQFLLHDVLRRDQRPQRRQRMGRRIPDMPKKPYAHSWKQLDFSNLFQF